MALHPQIQAILDSIGKRSPPVWDTVEPATVRAAMDRPADGPVEPVGSVQNRTIPGAEVDIAVRIYTPQGNGPHRLMLFYHGGGFVMGNLETHDGLARSLCNAANSVVVSVAYRLAPEHPFPAGCEDCYAALCWAAAHAEKLGTRVQTLAVAGTSAGASMAAVVCQMSADRNGPAIAYQLLYYPMTDCDFERPSYRENSEGYFLSRSMVQWFWRHYLTDPVDADRPYCTALRRRDFRELPPATVITAEYDPLRDEGQAYAEALASAGVPVHAQCWKGMIHGFVGFRQVDDAVAALQQSVDQYLSRVDSP